MEKTQKAHSRKTRQLLDLWMGNQETVRAPTSSIWPVVLLAILAGGCALLAGVRLEMVVFLGVVVACFLGLHELVKLLAQSELLSPGWLLIAALLVAFTAWFIVPPSYVVESVGGFAPAVVSKFMSNWGAAAGAPSPPAPAAAGEVAPAARPPAAPGAAGAAAVADAGSGGTTELEVNAAQAASVVGQPVTFYAQFLGQADPPLQRREVRFYDRAALLGTASLVKQDGLWLASLRVGGLKAGTHEITARVGAGGAASRALSHRVAGR